jgi:hypothetical protein
MKILFRTGRKAGSKLNPMPVGNSKTPKRTCPAGRIDNSPAFQRWVSAGQGPGRCTLSQIRYAEAVNFPNPHAAVDAENFERDRRATAALRADPALLRIAQANLQRWLQGDGAKPHPALVEWEAILKFLTPVEIADFLESRTPKAERLRQSSPFVGLFTPSRTLRRWKSSSRGSATSG